MSTAELEAAYRELDLSPGANGAEVKKAHRQHAKAWHPDRYEGDPEMRAVAERRLKRINHAAELIRAAGFPPAQFFVGQARGSQSPPPRERRSSDHRSTNSSNGRNQRRNQSAPPAAPPGPKPAPESKPAVEERSALSSAIDTASATVAICCLVIMALGLLMAWHYQ